MPEDGEEAEFTPLTHEILCQNLSNIELVVGGGGFAFTKLDCSDKDLTNLGNLGKGDNYRQLKHVVLSNNKLRDITAVVQLPHLLTLKLDGNQVETLECLQKAELPWCQRIDLSSNKLKTLPNLSVLERLRFANFGANAIESLEGFGSHMVLEELHLQGNKLESLVGLGRLERLRRLVLTGNQLTSLAGLDTPALAHLEVGKNQLASLQHISGAPRCEVLDISENQLASDDPELPEMKRLGVETPKLKELRLAGNPLADAFGENCKTEVLVRVPQLLRVEDEEVTAEDREAAKSRGQEIIEEARQRELEAKAAAAAAAEAGGGD